MDYRFEKTNNSDYLPESVECENCGDYTDDDHVYETIQGNLCPACYYKMIEELLNEGEN